MNVKIIREASFQVVVKSIEVNAQSSAQQIPAFWRDFFAQGYAEKLLPAMGICNATQLTADTYQYGIGCLQQFAPVEINGFETWTIPANSWAVFPCVGAMPQAIQQMWQRIYREWLPQSTYQLASGIMIERYQEGDTQSADYLSELWIAVQEKIIG